MTFLEWLASPPGLALVAALTGLLAVVFTPLSSLITTNKQVKAAERAAELNFKATFTSASRQAWINDVRKLLSEFISAATILASGVLRSRGRNVETVDEFRELFRKKTELLLMLNLSEPDHQDLAKILETLQERAMHGALTGPQPGHTDEVNFGTLSAVARQVASRILKAEWDEAKGKKSTKLPPRVKDLDSLLKKAEPTGDEEAMARAEKIRADVHDQVILEKEPEDTSDS